ncbi:MAG: hypothetical protein WCS96_04560 [Victivallales bacterium]
MTFTFAGRDFGLIIMMFVRRINLRAARGLYAPPDMRVNILPLEFPSGECPLNNAQQKSRLGN